MICKYRLRTTHTTLSLSEDHQVIQAQLQDGIPTVWANTELYQPQVEVTFHLVTTGSNPPPNSRYLSTIQQGYHVFHVYYQV